MKDVVIIEAFKGYPDGETEREFKAAPEPVSVPNDFADLIVGKGHAKWPKAAKPAPKSKPKSPSAPPAADPVPPAAAAEKTDGDET